jgi:hypothetical protein
MRGNLHIFNFTNGKNNSTLKVSYVKRQGSYHNQSMGSNNNS